MKVNWDQELQNVPLVAIRDMLRYTETRRGMHGVDSLTCGLLRHHGFDGYNHQNNAIMRNRARLLLSSLIASGLLEGPDDDQIRTGRRNEHPGFNLTVAGYGLINATKTKRIAREKAEKLVDELRERIEEINSNPIYLHDIEAVYLYGSYLTDTPDLGDIDGSYVLRSRYTDRGEYKIRRAEFEEAYPTPSTYNNYFSYNNFPEVALLRALKPSRYVHLSAFYKVDQLGCPMLKIFPYDEIIPAREDYVFDRPEIILRADKGEALALHEEAYFSARQAA